jgi:hypothetical protein
VRIFSTRSSQCIRTSSAVQAKHVISPAGGPPANTRAILPPSSWTPCQTAQSVPYLCVDDVAGRGVGDVGRPANGAYRLDGYDKDLQPVGVYRCTGGGKPGGSEVGLEMRTKKQTKPTPKHPKNGPPGNAKSLIYCRRGRDYSGLRPSPLRGRRHSRRSARPAVACRTA